jgi:CBS domain containing-hemolysin-like protein
MNLGLDLALALPVLALHMVSVALARALRTYSRSRLEEVCARHGRSERAAEVDRLDERTERGAEALAVLTGLGLAALLGAIAAEVAPQLEVQAVVGIALALGALGHVAAGIIGRVHAEALLDGIWPVACLVRRLMSPLTMGSRFVEALAYHLARRSPSAPRPASVEVEIHSSVDEPVQDLESELPESTRAALQRVIELTRRSVADMMTPQTAILALPASVSAAEAAQAFRTSGHSRIPLYGESRDDIVGILHVKDLFAALADPLRTQPPNPRKLARPAFFVPETKNANEMLDEFRIKRTHQAIVLDEYGGVAGLVTLEDLLEQIVGPIDDEHDEPTPEDPVISLGNGRYEVDATIPLEQLNERLGLHLPTNGSYQTVGGFAFHELGRLPETGATFRHDDAVFTVLEVGEHAIRRLMVDLEVAAPPVGRH